MVHVGDSVYCRCKPRKGGVFSCASVSPPVLQGRPVVPLCLKKGGLVFFISSVPIGTKPGLFKHFFCFQQVRTAGCQGRFLLGVSTQANVFHMLFPGWLMKHVALFILVSSFRSTIFSLFINSFTFLLRALLYVCVLGLFRLYGCRNFPSP